MSFLLNNLTNLHKNLIQTFGNMTNNNQNSKVSNALINAPSQTQIQKDIQKIAPNPTKNGGQYAGIATQATSKTQGFNGVNQGANGTLGMLKSLITTKGTTLKPITATNTLGNDWFNQVLANENAANQMRYRMGLANVLGNVIRGQQYENGRIATAQANLEADKYRTDKLVEVKKEYNNILNKYYTGLINSKEATSKLKKMGVNNPEAHLKQVEITSRIKKYPDPQTWWTKAADPFYKQNYDVELKNPQDINQAYQYYLATGQMPTPNIEKGGIFSSDKITGFSYPNNSTSSNSSNTNTNNSNNNTQYNTIMEEAKKQGINPHSIVESNGKQYLIDMQGNSYLIN